MCRAELPPGPEASFSEGCTIRIRAERAADNQGVATAQFNLALCYQQGDGMEQSMCQAAELYQLAAGQGHAEAQSSLASFYARGVGVEQSFQRAAELY